MILFQDFITKFIGEPLKLITMKKVNKIQLLFTVFSFLLFINFSQSQIPPKNDLEDLELIGKVKSLIQNEYEVSLKSGELIKGEIINDNGSNFHLVFDEFGNKIQEISRNSKYLNGFEKFTYEYDSKGNKIEKIYYTPDGSFNTKYSYKYDDNGNIIEMSDSFSEGYLGNKYTYKYDEKENLVEYNDYLGRKLDEKYIFEYDENGNEIEENWYNSNGNLVKKWIKKYDDKGNIIENIFYYSEGKIDSRTIYKYDTNNNILEEIITDSNNNILSEEYNKYDNNGRIIEVKMNVPSYGDMKVKTLYKYDDKGNLIEQINNSSMGGRITKGKKKFEYDKNNNWVKTIFFSGNKPLGLIERIIEYY